MLKTIISAQITSHKPLTYIAYKTSEKITVDGKADEAIWHDVAFSSPFVDIEGKKQPQFRTQIKMLWDETYWYFGISKFS